MRTLERGMIKPKPLTALTLPELEKQEGKVTQNAEEKWSLKNPFKWNPNRHMPTLLAHVAPLNDNTLTPTSAKRAI